MQTSTAVGDRSGQILDEKFLQLQQVSYASSKRLLAYITNKIPARLRATVDAQDVLQDTFLEAFRSIHNYNPLSDNDAYFWLATIARRRILMFVKHQKTKKRGGDWKREESAEGTAAIIEEFAVYVRTPSQSAMSHELAAAVQRSMNQIKPVYREVLRMRYMQGMSLTQSAQFFGQSEEAVRSLIRRSLKALTMSLPQGILLR